MSCTSEIDYNITVFCTAKLSTEIFSQNFISLSFAKHAQSMCIFFLFVTSGSILPSLQIMTFAVLRNYGNSLFNSSGT
jgi:hypothetical protein